MPRKVVISDASPIIALNNVGELSLLKQLYDEILITDIVLEEIQINIPHWIKIDTSYDASLYQSLCTRLDRGEASAIA